MRWFLLILSPVVFSALTGCDYVRAEPVTKRWISYGTVGLEVTKRADRYGGKLYWLSKNGEEFRDAFCSGLFDDQAGTLVFPLGECNTWR